MPGTVQSIVRAAAVLRVLGAAGEPVALGELARTLELPKATVHGLVRTLCEVGFATQQPDTGRYSLGHGLAAVAEPLDPHLLRSRAMNWADGLAARTGLEVQIGVNEGTSLTLVHHVFRPDGSPQHLRIGERQPLHATALGWVLLAYSPISLPLQRLDLVGYTARTTTSPTVLAQELRRVRRRGWAVVDEQLRPGIAALAAPIHHHEGAVVGAMAVVGPRDQIISAVGEPRERLPELVTSAAHAVAGTLQERL